MNQQNPFYEVPIQQITARVGSLDFNTGGEVIGVTERFLDLLFPRYKTDDFGINLANDNLANDFAILKLEKNNLDQE